VRVHLVDGTFELFRAYYGAPPVRSAAGGEVGAGRGLARTLLALVRDGSVTHVGIAFDHVIESFRNELFAGYKTGEGIPEDLLGQFGLAERVARALGFVVWPMVEFEADDALATAAAHLARDGRVEQVVVCSPDKDLAQCVQGARVVCLDRLRDRLYDEGAVWQKFGVLPPSIPDWLALVGDTADGIPGVPRWGARSARALLGRYGRIEEIPPDPKAWEVPVRGAAALASSLLEHREAAALYKRLATLRTDAPVEDDLEDLRWRGPRTPGLRDVADEMDDPGLLEAARAAGRGSA
jgi:5'-3' exonuclease